MRINIPPLFPVLRSRLLPALTLWAALCAAGSDAALAHVVLEQPSTRAGSSTRVALRVGHGCEGAATTAIRVRIPAGFTGAKPMPKPGWLLKLQHEALETPLESHGKTIREAVREITWTAATTADALPDAWYDEFVLRGTAPAQAGVLWFQVWQTCGTTQLDWVQVPTQGVSVQGLKTPAAPLQVLADAPTGHAH